MVHDGRLYLYTTHDEDVTVDNFFTMNDWRVYSTQDVVNWTDHGSPLHYHDFTWARGSAWAGQVVARNDKFYFYVPMVQKNGANAIGVAISDSPIGPFKDPIGTPLVTSDCGDIDPTVFIDDDEQAYLYWGNPNLCYVKLNRDMTSYAGAVVRVAMNTASFGVRADSDRPTSYEEGPWFYKREGRYYMVYPGGPLPEHIAYSTSDSPTGPWTYKSVIMPAAGASFTNHPGVVDFGGKSLFFYHNGALPGGGGFKRSVSVEEFTYGTDGSIPRLRMTEGGATATASLNPFEQVEAETIAWNSGVETEVCSEGGMNVTSIDTGDHIKIKGVDFGAGATTFAVRIAAASNSGAIALRLDGAQGTQFGSCAVTSTGGAATWATQSCEVAGAQGKHDLFLVFTGGGFKFNWWKFSGPGAAPATTGTQGPATGTSASTATSSEATAGSAQPSTSTSTTPDVSSAPASHASSAPTSAETAASNSGPEPASTSGNTAAPSSTTAQSSSGSTKGASTVAQPSDASPNPTSSADLTTPREVNTTTSSSSCGVRVGKQTPDFQALIGALGLIGMLRMRTRYRGSHKRLTEAGLNVS
jgi:hypothetical protein